MGMSSLRSKGTKGSLSGGSLVLGGDLPGGDDQCCNSCLMEMYEDFWDEIEVLITNNWGKKWKKSEKSVLPSAMMCE